MRGERARLADLQETHTHQRQGWRTDRQQPDLIGVCRQSTREPTQPRVPSFTHKQKQISKTAQPQQHYLVRLSHDDEDVSHALRK